MALRGLHVPPGARGVGVSLYSRTPKVFGLQVRSTMCQPGPARQRRISPVEQVGPQYPNTC